MTAEARAGDNAALSEAYPVVSPPSLSGHTPAPAFSELPVDGASHIWNGLPTPAAELAVVRAGLAFSGLTLVVAATEQQALRLAEVIRFFAGAQIPVLHFPDNETLPYDPFSPHQEILSERMATLYGLSSLLRGILIVTAGSLLERLPPKRWLDAHTVLFSVGERLSLQGFRQRLVAAGYQSVSEVQTQGEFAVRGSLLDLFPMGSREPLRVDLFDEEIESIRSFDPQTQRSLEKVERIRLLPAREFPTNTAGMETFRGHYRAYFPGDPARSRIYADVSRGLMPAGIESYLPLFFDETATLFDYLPAQRLWMTLCDLRQALDTEYQQIEERFERLQGDLARPLMRPADLYAHPRDIAAGIESSARIRVEESGSHSGVLPLPPDAEAIAQFIRNSKERVLIVAESAGRREAVLDWLKPRGLGARECSGWQAFLDDRNHVGITLGPIERGVRLLDDGVAIVGEPQIFGERPPTSLRRRGKIRDPETILRDLNDLKPGAPVVHIEHGVGRYRGLQHLDTGGIAAEYLVIEYASGDKLYVPVADLARVHRYTGADPENAPLHALGSDRWSKARARAAERAHDVAAELLQIQARRAARPGQSMVVEASDYERFSQGFPFTPTPDQQKAIDAVIEDLAQTRAMDRVVCGDVGFGKTEVALRACFVAASAGRQVCVLAPTTLLVQQHEKNFLDRFAGWPLRIASLSRMKSRQQQEQLLSDLADGRVNIVIGTHRLLQDDVRFQSLGLVVIDEEHRFGVRHKERLKNMRAEVDLLTLTATPIPRTLNMSLAGLRDLSIIATPPEERLAIRTFVADWDAGLVYEACLRELRRGGQVYFLHNEVRDIDRFAKEIQRLVPEAHVRFAHGQMRERELEQVMVDFYHGRFNVLVCSTIIESGIDVPNANTILIDRADTFGLAQLHQLRGRVGRSHHRAYAYLLVPARQALSRDAAQRLEAIEQLGELGSGFTLATQDLEIRGAGELLGEQQSGQIDEVGFTLYADLLAQAIRGIKSGRIDDEPFGRSICTVDLGVAALIPETYVPDVDARLVLYKRLAETRDEASLEELKVEMVDRFGPLPDPLRRLCEAARLRQIGESLGIAKIRLHRTGAALDFQPRASVEPTSLIRLLQSEPKVYRMEGQTRTLANWRNEAPIEERLTRLHTMLAKLKPILPAS
jgi:transcription-repair coupling factor (superfamily II helicase)